MNASREVDTLVVGEGYTAIFAAGVLHSLQVDRNRTLLVTHARVGSVGSSFASGRDAASISMPIFPPSVETALSGLLEKISTWPPDIDAEGVGLLDISFAFGEVAEPVDFAAAGLSVAPGSYAEHATGVSLSLACKQFGTKLCLTQPLNELKQKVARHYSGSRFPASRIGFVGGESAYASAAREVLAGLDVLTAGCCAVDASSRHIVTTAGERIRYRRLIYCGGVHSLQACLAQRAAELVGAPAIFVSARLGDGVPTNVLRYDLRSDSPILRAFVPQPGLLVAQLAVDPDLDRLGHPSNLRSWLESLLNSEVSAVAKGSSRLEDVYPLEPLSKNEAERLDELCAIGNVTRFGRFAEWRYIDLDELEWMELARLASE